MAQNALQCYHIPPRQDASSKQQCPECASSNPTGSKSSRKAKSTAPSRYTDTPDVPDARLHQFSVNAVPAARFDPTKRSLIVKNPESQRKKRRERSDEPEAGPKAKDHLDPNPSHWTEQFESGFEVRRRQTEENRVRRLQEREQATAPRASKRRKRNTEPTSPASNDDDNARRTPEPGRKPWKIVSEYSRNQARKNAEMNGLNKVNMPRPSNASAPISQYATDSADGSQLGGNSVEIHSGFAISPNMIAARPQVLRPNSQGSLGTTTRNASASDTHGPMTTDTAALADHGAFDFGGFEGCASYPFPPSFAQLDQVVNQGNEGQAVSKTLDLNGPAAPMGSSGQDEWHCSQVETAQQWPNSECASANSQPQAGSSNVFQQSQFLSPLAIHEPFDLYTQEADPFPAKSSVLDHLDNSQLADLAPTTFAIENQNSFSNGFCHPHAEPTYNCTKFDDTPHVTQRTVFPSLLGVNMLSNGGFTVASNDQTAQPGIIGGHLAGNINAMNFVDGHMPAALETLDGKFVDQHPARIASFDAPVAASVAWPNEAIDEHHIQALQAPVDLSLAASDVGGTISGNATGLGVNMFDNRLDIDDAPVPDPLVGNQIPSILDLENSAFAGGDGTVAVEEQIAGHDFDQYGPQIRGAFEHSLEYNRHPFQIGDGDIDATEQAFILADDFGPGSFQEASVNDAHFPLVGPNGEMGKLSQTKVDGFDLGNFDDGTLWSAYTDGIQL